MMCSTETGQVDSQATRLLRAVPAPSSPQAVRQRGDPLLSGSAIPSEGRRGPRPARETNRSVSPCLCCRSQRQEEGGGPPSALVPAACTPDLCATDGAVLREAEERGRPIPGGQAKANADTLGKLQPTWDDPPEPGTHQGPAVLHRVRHHARALPPQAPQPWSWVPSAPDAMHAGLGTAKEQAGTGDPVKTKENISSHSAVLRTLT